MWTATSSSTCCAAYIIRIVAKGYTYERVDDAACRSSAQPSNPQVTRFRPGFELAELLIQTIPCAERVRFFKTGTEATMAAIRAARNHTGRNLVAQCGFHGWTDLWRNTGGPGVDPAPSQSVKTFDGTAQSLARLLNSSAEKFAAVILCPC